MSQIGGRTKAAQMLVFWLVLIESSLSFQAVINGRDELSDGKVFLHDIIDLEATYAGPDARTVPAAGRRCAAGRAPAAATRPWLSSARRALLVWLCLSPTDCKY
jgi:hypothetical protein